MPKNNLPESEPPAGAPELPGEADVDQLAANQVSPGSDDPAEIEPDAQADNEKATEPKDDASDTTEANSTDSPSEPVSSSSIHGGRCKRFFRRYWRHKWWTLPLTVVAIIAILLAIPFTRYHILGLFLSRDYQITVVDSDNSQPVSGVNLSLDGQPEGATDADGHVSFTAKLGRHNLTLGKKYYRQFNGQIFVGILTGDDKNQNKLRLTATGRPIAIKLTNKINHQPISNAVIKVADTTSKTNQKGQVTIVLPTGAPELKANLSAKGYNSKDVKIQLKPKSDSANDFELTPAGKVYFLSNASGKYNVDSSNLDGTDRKTIVSGTGHESSHGTALFMSPDGGHGILIADRSGTGTPQIYSIDTSTSKISTVDDSNSRYEVVGWSSKYFVYQSYRQDKSNWQSGNILIRSYDTTLGKTSTLVANKAEGHNDDDYAYQGFNNATIIDGKVYYTVIWINSYTAQDKLKGKQQGMYRISLAGKAKPDALKTFSVKPDNYLYIGALQVSPSSLIYDVSDGSDEVYYRYADGRVFHDNTVTGGDFSSNSSAYYTSPSGKQTFWSDKRNGQLALLLSDTGSQHPKQLGGLGDYQAYGWLTNKYLLLTKQNSLYIMPSTGLAKSQSPIKLGNYLANPDRYDIS